MNFRLHAMFLLLPTNVVEAQIVGKNKNYIRRWGVSHASLSTDHAATRQSKIGKRKDNQLVFATHGAILCSADKSTPHASAMLVVSFIFAVGWVRRTPEDDFFCISS